MLSKSQIKDIKNDLRHLNKVYSVFKLQSIIKNLDEKSRTPYIQELLRTYLISEKVLITEEQIEKSKIKIKEVENA
jgi:hypothetical protein